MTTSPRPGTDWLRPEATTVPRRRNPRQRAKLLAAALVTGAVGAGVWWATGHERSDTAPLSFFLEEQLPGATGIAFEHQLGAFAPFFDNVKPFMAAVSASACTADVDRDGDLDLYMTNAGPGTKNALFLNQLATPAGPGKAWTFVRADMPALDGNNGEDGFSSDCVFADVDNDGFADLFVGAIAQAPRIFHNEAAPDGSRVFVDVSAAAGIPAYMNGFAVVFFDVENDGDLDLLLSSYFGENYLEEDIPGRPRIHNFKVPAHDNAGRMMPNNWGNATNGGQKHLLLNDGAGHFAAQDLAAWGLTDTRFTFDIGTADVNLDGFTDVYFANDFGPDQLFINTGGKNPGGTSSGGKRFVEQRGVMPTDVGRDPFKGMNADLADIDHDGFPEIYVTNVFHPVLPEGNLLWRNLPDASTVSGRTFQNVAAELGAKDGGWGWGAKFVDLDLDGDTDLVETNGYISQSNTSEYWYRLSRLVAGDRRLIVDTRKWPAFGDRSMSGHQVSHVFVWDGHRFHNRAADVGVTRSFDGRGVLIADFDSDGRPDVLYVAQGAPSFLGKNAFRPTADQADAPHWVGLRLEGDGTRVNRDAVGVRVEVRPSDPKAASAPLPLFREVSAGNGMSAESMSWIVAGLGGYTGTVDVVVRWTDGSTSEHKGLAADRYHSIRYGAQTALLGGAR